MTFDSFVCFRYFLFATLSSKERRIVKRKVAADCWREVPDEAVRRAATSDFVIRPMSACAAFGVLSVSLLIFSLAQAQSPGSQSSFERLAKQGSEARNPDPNLRLEAAYREGLLLLRADKFKAAQITFKSLCRAGMQRAEVLQNIGLSYLRISLRDSPPAVTSGKGIVQAVGHAACLAAQEQVDAAREEYHALEEAHPKYPYIHYAVGRFWADMDDVSAAVAEFQKELKNQPNDINSRLEIAAAEYKLDSAMGVPYAEEAVKLNPNVPSAHYLLGLLYLDTDNYRKAIPELEIARKALPNDAKICFALGSAYARAGRKEDAARARAAFLRLSKQSASIPAVTH